MASGGISVTRTYGPFNPKPGSQWYNTLQGAGTSGGELLGGLLLLGLLGAAGSQQGGGTGTGGGDTSPQIPGSGSIDREFETAIANFETEIGKVTTEGKKFADPDFLGRYIKEGYDRFDATTREAFSAEVNRAKESLRNFQETSPDARQSARLQVSRGVLAQIYGEQQRVNSQVYSQFADQMTQVTQAAAQNNATLSGILADANAAVLGARTSFSQTQLGELGALQRTRESNAVSFMNNLIGAASSMYSTNIDAMIGMANVQASRAASRDSYKLGLKELQAQENRFEASLPNASRTRIPATETSRSVFTIPVPDPPPITSFVTR